MAPRRRRRTACAIGLSLVLHVLALTSMVIGLKVLSPPSEGRAVELRLVTLPEVMPRLETVRRAAPRSAAPSLRQRPAPQPAPEALAAAPSQTPASAASAEAGGKGLLPGLWGRMGCDDPAAFRLTPEQRQACLGALAQRAATARPLGLNLSDQKKTAFDRYEHCRNYYRNDPTVPLSQQIVPETGKPPEPGYIPSFKECPLADRF